MTSDPASPILFEKNRNMLAKAERQRLFLARKSAGGLRIKQRADLPPRIMRFRTFLPGAPASTTPSPTFGGRVITSQVLPHAFIRG
jgi:hypothetical protein